MVVRSFTDLLAWRLCNELKCEVFAFTADGAASKDFKFRDQIRDSSASAERNIAEGFGRFRPKDFVRYLEFAKGSLAETQSSLIDARDRRYLSVSEFQRLSNLARAAERTTTRLLMSKRRQIDP